jgi:hypothetical protein
MLYKRGRPGGPVKVPATKGGASSRRQSSYGVVRVPWKWGETGRCYECVRDRSRSGGVSKCQSWRWMLLVWSGHYRIKGNRVRLIKCARMERAVIVVVETESHRHPVSDVVWHDEFDVQVGQTEGCYTSASGRYGRLQSPVVTTNDMAWYVCCTSRGRPSGPIHVVETGMGDFSRQS